jgi:sulfonate transport system substrate-binding protein
LTEIEQREPVRTVIETDGLFSHRSLWFTSRAFSTERRDELAAIIAALQESDAWVRQNYRAAAELFAAEDGGDLDAWEHALRTRPWGLNPVEEEFVAEQQHAADLFYANGLIGQRIQVADAVVPEINDLVKSNA